MNSDRDHRAAASAAAGAAALQDTAAALRKRLFAVRRALTVTQRREAAAAIGAHLRAGLMAGPAQRLRLALAPRRPVIAAFWPMPDEPDLRPLLAELAGAGETVALPRIAQRAAPLEFLPWTPDAPMREGAYGIAEPVGDTPCRPDILLVPALGHTRRGERLGYGGGYYDRTLAALRAADHPHLTIGVAWAACRLSETDYRFAPHDVRLDAIVDEDGWHEAEP